MHLTDYAQHSPMTDPREHAGRLRDLPSDLPSVCRVVQGLLIHPWKAHRYAYDQNVFQPFIDTSPAVNMPAQRSARRNRQLSSGTRPKPSQPDS